MSKHKESKPAPLADWDVSLDRGEYNPAAGHRIPQARWKRTDPGWYTFSDDEGVVAEFAPGTVLSVTRLVPPPPDAPADKALAAVAARTVLAAKRQNGKR